MCFHLSLLSGMMSVKSRQERSGPASDRCPAASNSPVCWCVLPVYQHRSVRYPLGTPTSAINQTFPGAAVKVSYVLLIRSQLKNMTHNAYFFLQQQAIDHYHIGSRSLTMCWFCFCGKLLSAATGFFLALSTERHARGPWVHDDACLDPARAP